METYKYKNRICNIFKWYYYIMYKIRKYKTTSRRQFKKRSCYSRNLYGGSIENISQRPIFTQLFGTEKTI